MESAQPLTLEEGATLTSSTALWSCDTLCLFAGLSTGSCLRNRSFIYFFHTDVRYYLEHAGSSFLDIRLCQVVGMMLGYRNLRSNFKSLLSLCTLYISLVFYLRSLDHDTLCLLACAGSRSCNADRPSVRPAYVVKTKVQTT